MSRMKTPEKFHEENLYLVSIWEKLGHPDIDDLIEKYGSDEYKQWCKEADEEEEMLKLEYGRF